MKTTYSSLVLGILLFYGSILLPVHAEDKNTGKVYVIPVSGTVEPGMAAYVKRALKDIENETGAVFLFKLDTFGGRVDAALDIVDYISNIPKGKTISYVEKRAISAGALIALSSSELYMKTNTLIGDCAPIIATKEGQEMAGEKVQTVLRARFRALAKKNNYPEVLAESMVTIDMAVYRVTINGETRYMSKKEYDDLTEDEKKAVTAKKTIVAEGELLTMDDVEAQTLGFSQKSVKNIEEVLKIAGYSDYEVVMIEENWSESLVRKLQPLLPILMLIGAGALYTEIKSPGFGIPGIIGLICLGIVFFNQYLVGLADYTEAILFLIGALLMGMEVFVLPGFGISGILGILVIGAGLVLAFQGFVMPDPALPWEGRLLLNNLARVIGSFMGAFIVSLGMIRYVLPRISRVVDGPYLEKTLQDSTVDTASELNIKPGDDGVVHAYLRPSGKVIFKGKKVDAITQGEFIEKGTRVVVVKIDGNRVIVRPEE